jgi:signal peptidase I
MNAGRHNSPCIFSPGKGCPAMFLLTWLFLIGNVVLLLVLLGIFTRFAYLIVTVKGNSMFPTLAEGDRVVVLSWWPRGCLRKGQIILFEAMYTVLLPPFDKSVKFESMAGQLHIKRVVAVAGEQVITSINDVQEGERPRLAQDHDEQGRRIWHIPSGHVFVRGDNRNGSIDSLIAGPLPLQSVRGLVLMKLPETFFP